MDPTATLDHDEPADAVDEGNATPTSNPGREKWRILLKEGDVVDAKAMDWHDAVVMQISDDRIRVHFRDLPLQSDLWLNKYDANAIQPLLTKTADWPQLGRFDACEIYDNGSWSEGQVIDFIPATTDDTNNYVIVVKDWNMPARRLPTTSEILRRMEKTTGSPTTDELSFPLPPKPPTTSLADLLATGTATSSTTAARWEFIATSPGGTEWMAYEDTVSRAIERRWQENQVLVMFTREGVRYGVNFETMIQWCDEVGTERPIRRVETTTEPPIRRRLEPPTISPPVLAPQPPVPMRAPRPLSTWFRAQDDSSSVVWEKQTYDPGDAEEATPESDVFYTALGHYVRLSGSTASRVQQVELYKSEKTTAAFEEMKNALKARGSPVKEMYVYHGTREANIEEIMINGFQVGGEGVPVRHGSTYGRGVYAATGPRTPERFAKDSNKIILARALPGVGGTSETDDCDSWRRPGLDYVIFRHGVQLLPVYVIHLNNDCYQNRSPRPAAVNNAETDRSIVCPHCRSFNTWSKYTEGLSYDCQKCKKPWQQVTCPHCLRDNVWQDSTYIPGTIVECTHCGKAFGQRPCPSCFGSIVLSFPIPSQPYSCTFRNCQAPRVFIVQTPRSLTNVVGM